MHAQAETPIARNNLDHPEVSLARGGEAGRIWAIYHAGRVASQPNAEIGLLESHVERLFRVDEASFPGKDMTSWYHMILDRSGLSAVMAIRDEVENPVAAARVHIDQEGNRWLANLCVASPRRGRGYAGKLIEGADQLHGGEAYSLKVAAYNEAAISAYEKADFEVVGQDGYDIYGIHVPQLVMTRQP